MKEKLPGIQSETFRKYEKAYIAIPLPKSDLLTWVLQLNPYKHFVHLSLFFLGDIGKHQLPKVENALFSNLNILRGVTLVPNRLDIIGDHPQAFVVRMANSPQLTEFRKSLERDLPEFTPFNMLFVPHVTIRSAGRGFSGRDVAAFLKNPDRCEEINPILPKLVGIYYRRGENATAVLTASDI